MINIFFVVNYKYVKGNFFFRVFTFYKIKIFSKHMIEFCFKTRFLGNQSREIDHFVFDLFGGVSAYGVNYIFNSNTCYILLCIDICNAYKHMHGV